MRNTGSYVTTATLGESVQAFVPHALPPKRPALALESFVKANRVAELALALLSGVSALVPEPLMYLSSYLKQYHAEYYRRLSNVRIEGDWEGWVVFFLEGVTAAAGDAERGIVAIASLLSTYRRRLLDSPKAGPASYRLFEILPMMPRFTIEQVRQKLDTSFPTANAAVKVLEGLGIAVELTGQKKNRSYSYQSYVELMTD